MLVRIEKVIYISFQHTYEGLKHKFFDEIGSAVQKVFSIPMRD